MGTAEQQRIKSADCSDNASELWVKDETSIQNKQETVDYINFNQNFRWLYGHCLINQNRRFSNLKINIFVNYFYEFLSIYLHIYAKSTL